MGRTLWEEPAGQMGGRAGVCGWGLGEHRGVCEHAGQLRRALVAFPDTARGLGQVARQGLLPACLAKLGSQGTCPTTHTGGEGEVTTVQHCN